ncbi:MAG: 16S rRNA (cytosine(1402)-N(4))-methyltransferase RsmH [Gemmatimonadota bacterium]|jgi:16S rRNA (cytosine1402-N4)-methyltransferase
MTPPGQGYHEPVLVPEVLELLAPRGEGLYLDGTVGGGGHALRILERCPGCRILAVDRDPDALAAAGRVLSEHRQRVRFLEARFDRATLDIEVRARGLDGGLLDLGVSSRQIDEESRGFTFRPGAPLDMRMGGADADTATAAELLDESSEEELERIFREFGEERRARRIARQIVRRRGDRPLRTSDDLVEVIQAAFGHQPSPRDRARIFQAVRIAVNRELEALEEGLPAIREALNDGAVLVVIAYHSLEDRIVKHTFREWSRDCVCPPGLPVCRCRGRALGETLTRKPVRPSASEVEANPRARSARLRAWRKAA